MMKLERTKNTIKNTAWGLANNIVGIILPFAIRTIILHLLSREYLGLNSLFTSILSMLNLSDLGFGSAIVYSMYKPIAENDVDKVCALLAFYKKVYRVIGYVVLGAGLCITPFIKVLINGSYPQDINIYMVFLVELVNTSISYFFFAYRESLLQAHQRTDVSSKILVIVRMIKYLVQIFVLVIFKNFYLYIIVGPLSTVALNMLSYRASMKLYPQFQCRGTLKSETKNEIKHQVGGLMISKVCGVTRNGLDNIIISGFIGLSAVAIYGNYYYLLVSIHTMLGVIGTSMRAGVGNSIASELVEKNYNDMNKFTFLYAWISGFCTCCFVGLYQPFMEIWVGADNMFPTWIMLLFCVYFYIMTMTDIRNIYIDATGIWWQNKMRPIIETVMNLILNVMLAKFFGTAGVVLATIISLSIVNIGYGSKVLFDAYFRGYSLKHYFASHLFYLLVTALAAVITFACCNLIPFGGVIGLIAKMVVCLLVPNTVFVLLYCKHPQFVNARNTVKAILSTVRK